VVLRRGHISQSCVSGSDKAHYHGIICFCQKTGARHTVDTAADIL